jgi:hypothetical protein
MPAPLSAHAQAQVERTKTFATVLLTSVEADEREAARLLLAKVATDAEIASLRVAVGEARALFATRRELDPLFRANEARLAELRVQSQDLQAQIGIHRRSCQAKQRRNDLERIQEIVQRNVTPEQWTRILLELETDPDDPVDAPHPSPPGGSA